MKKTKTKPENKIRKYADFFPEKNPLDKELIETFFPETGFQHDSLGLIPLNTTDTIKSLLTYFKKNIIDAEKLDNLEKNSEIKSQFFNNVNQDKNNIKNKIPLNLD